MPIQPTYPGVYIEELPSGVRTIVGVSTSVAAFIDFFSRGPLNTAVQVFNMGDFQREFGGLHAHSEASYGIQQFFLNGGSEAWVIRAATANSSTASITMASSGGTSVLAATAGRRLRGNSVVDPGEWGNNVRIDVDYNTTETATFNMAVSEVQTQGDRQIALQTEEYRNVSMDPVAANYVVEVVNGGSKLVQLARLTVASDTTTLPAQTGTVGSDATGAETAIADGNTFDIGYNGNTAAATVSFTTAPTSLQDVRGILQAAIQTAGAALTVPEPMLTNATVQLVGTQFRVLAGRSGANYSSETLLTFSDTSGTSAADMGLASGNEVVNVQQYALGSTTSVGQQVGGTVGSNGSLPNDLPDADALRGVRDPDKSGLYALEDVDIFNILCIPRAAQLSSSAMSAVVSEAQAYCEERRAFYIVDLPPTIDTQQESSDWLDQNAVLRHPNAAVYFPNPRIPDPLQDFRLRSVGASGTVAGLYARTDSARGIWKAPAGIEANLRNVPDLDYKLSDPENGQINPLGLNALRNFKIYGNVAWGARTLMGADQQLSQWKYVPVRRLALYIEESLYRGTQWVVFEPNDAPLWAQIRLNVGAFMHNLFRQGAFQGVTPREAYLVKCDHETTTQNDIDRGIVNILVGFKPLKPAEFVIIQIQQLAGQVEV